MSSLAPDRAPPLSLVAPFFVAAPLGLAAAGWLLAFADGQVFLGAATPRLVAATHASVLGCLTLAMMGAIYQLGPAVLKGRLVSAPLARAQFAVHAVSIVALVVAVNEWNVTAMSAAGVGLVLSFALFVVNAVPALRWFRGGPPTRTYFSVALLFLVATGALGVTYVGALEHLWFPLTQGRIAGHAHLGLVGWLALMLMGASYQLLPMFQLAHHHRPRFARLALVVTAGSAGLGSLVLMTDPSPTVRLGVAAGMSLGPALWMWDMLSILNRRNRRVNDIQYRATVISLIFLAVAIGLGLAAAVGQRLSLGGEPARLQVAYGIAAIAGWGGITLVANSFKVVPFLTWYARYRTLAGVQPVPLISELTSTSHTHVVLAIQVAAVIVLCLAALIGNLALFRTGGALLFVGGTAHSVALLLIVVRRPSLQASIPTLTASQRT